VIHCDQERAAASVVGARNQETAHAAFAHFGEVIFCGRSSMVHNRADRAEGEAAA
jgi:hypothetical protein